MWAVSSTWLAALSKPHGRYTRMEAWFNGVKVATIPVESGSVQVTAQNRIRRTLTAVVSEGFWPTSTSSPLAPYGQQLKVWQGITGAGGVLIPPEIPVFTGRVEAVDRTRRSGKVTVTGTDPFSSINDAQFEQPRVATVGNTVLAQIRDLIDDVWPSASFTDLTGAAAVVPTGTTWATDRGQAIDDLATSIGGEVFCLPDGQTFVIRPVPRLGGVSAWSLVQGQNSTVIRDVMSRSRTDVANRIVVHVEQPGATPFTVTVGEDTGSTGSLGPYGPVVRHLTNALISLDTQARAAGAARLARTLGITRQRQVDVVPNPALEAGDLLTITTDEGTEQHIADQFTLPLGVADVMTIQTRSTGTSVS